ncbi:hypothetical protein EfmJHP35_02780 [Enterococcus faecium]|nr:hypothetical protein EfmJHP35_02780 [Enterococcus faecium]
MLTIDDLVPQDHLVRKIDAALDFEFIYPIVEATYSDLGRMQKKSMGCVGPSIEAWKSRDAYDASVCCNEFKEISHLAMERQGAFIFCSKIRNEVDKKLFQARVTSLEQLLSTV